MTTFVLIHGAWHGAWCWERFVPALEARGHRAIAMDLAVDDPSASFEDHAGVVIDAMDDAPPGGGVLVGHSLGSMIAPIVAAKRKVDAIVFLCGVIPKFGGLPWDDSPEMAAPGAFDALVAHDDGSVTWPTLEAATFAFYDDCTPDDAAWAFSKLRPNNPRSLWDRPYPLDAWPDAKRISIVGTDDHAVTLEWSRFVASTRLDVEPIELPGSHSPFLARPEMLADTMVGAVR